MTPRSLHWNLRAYEHILILYPEELRREFGREMLEAFAQDLSAECALRVWRITLGELIRIGIPAWLQIPAVAVAAISSAMAIATQSPLLVMTFVRKEDASPLYALCAITIGGGLTAVTSFVAVHRWKRAGLISLNIGMG
jgi:hypothetical protein